MFEWTRASTFIWDPSSPGSIDQWKRPYPSFANPPMCVPIPSNLTLCHGIKYNEMRIPNLLHHDTLNEVIQQSESWLQLTQLKCHSDTQLFLCSLFTPVCLDQTIPPCRSLCESVQKGCEPSMMKHGYSWPNMMRCDQFPFDNNMCIQSQTNQSPQLPPINKPDLGQDKQDESSSKKPESKFYRHLMNSICNSDWVIKFGSNQFRNDQLRIKKYKLVQGNMGSLPADSPLNISVNDTMTNDVITTLNSRSNVGRKKQKFIIIGVGNGSPDSPLIARVIVNWNNQTSTIKKAIKRSKMNGSCNSYKTQTNAKTKLKQGRRRQRRPNGQQRRPPN